MNPRRDEKVIKEFGKRLKSARKEREWSIRRLALEADIESSQIYRFEKGISDPRLTTIVMIANALEIDPGQLIRGKGK